MGVLGGEMAWKENGLTDRWMIKELDADMYVGIWM